MASPPPPFPSPQLQRMVDQLRRYGIKDDAVLAAMARIPRHHFLPEGAGDADGSYGDHPSCIGHGQTISQPYIVAYMTERLHLTGSERVFEVGSGSGYQTAVLAEMAAAVFSVERISTLAAHARRAIADAGYTNVQIRHGDGFAGWPRHAPFDRIIVTCAPENIPEPLLAQLAVGGRMIIPVGAHHQQLILIRRTEDRLVTEPDIPVRFVPMLQGANGRT